MAQHPIVKDNVKIWIAPADSAADDLEDDHKYSSYITNYSDSGVENDVEKIDTFGGQLKRKTPAEEIELSFDVIFVLDSEDPEAAQKIDELKEDNEDKMVAIQGGDDDRGYYWNAFNNVTITNLSKEFDAEDEWVGTMTLKLTPLDMNGNKNYQYGSSAPADDTDDGIQSWS